MITFNFKILMIRLISFATAEAYSTIQPGFKINTLFSVSLDNFPLRNIAYDDLNKSFFVSGRNILYKFNFGNSGPSLTKLTGPNYTCFAETNLNAKYCGDDKNLVMVVTPDFLITCSTLYGGRCIKRNKMTLNEENAAHPYIQLVSDITGSALGKLVNITVHDVSGVRYSKELLLFAKTPMELPKSVPKLNRSVLFSVGSNLQGKYFNNFLTENDIFDLFLKPTYISSMDYRSMFENDDFVFLLFNQNSKAKLAKLCKSIDKYNPKRVYEDIPIYCKDGNKTFDVIVDGKFINASGDRYLTAIFTNFAAGSSALCMFSEFEIYDAFLKSRRDRYGCPYHDLPNNELIFDDSQNLPKCVYLLLSESELFSGISDAFKKQCFCNNVTNMVPQFGIVIGILPLFGKSVYGTQNVITVIGDQIVDEFTLLYLGTHEGSVIKLLVNKTFSVHYIETIRIDKSEIRAIIDINEDPVILTENKIVTITPTDCEVFNQSCSNCMQAKSPHCGWCISKHSCTTKLICEEEHSLWISSLKNQCLTLLLDKDAFDVESGLKSNLTVNFLPPLTTSRTLSCLLDGIPLITYQGGLDLKCEIDHTLSRKQHYRVDPGYKLLKILLEGRVIAETSVLFYRCGDMKSCRECLENLKTTCYWCSMDVICARARGDCAPLFCPLVLNKTARISSRSKQNVTFPGRNLKLSYSKEEPTKDFHVLFKYGLNIPSRNLESFGNKTFISAYKCEYLSPDKRDCSRCKYLNVVEGFNCVWCGKLYGCVESEICTDNPTCSPPEIDKIEPTDGPIGGGTFIKIEGRNLGASLAEVTNVTVAGVKCSNLHFVQTSLQCTTGKSNGPLSGDVMVLVSGHWSNRTVKFQYKTPEITGIYPESIIKSGVRIIRIAGQNINIGNRKYQVILSPLNSSEQNKTCAIDMDQSTDDGEIFCIPEKSDVLGEHVVQVVFDSKTITKLKDKFLTYLSNPYINGTTPPSTNMKSIMSGGLGFLVQGQGFVDVIENILISLSESSIEGPKCSRQSSVLLYCKFPQMQQEGQQTRKKRDIVYQTIVIHIDGFKFVISRTVIYVSDPVIFELNGNRSFNYDPSSENRNIYVKGDQLNTITDIKDYFVHVGSGECVILELFSDTLKCLPPYKEPSPRLSEDKLYIRVRVGNINTIIGVVQYPLRGTATSVSNNTLYTILASLAFLIVIACVAFILIRQRKQDKVKTTKRTRVSMENIQGDSVVADFGLSRDIYEKDYYSSSNKKTRLPVKWMAPESLEKGIYSSQSDVWSFGVTMWELLTRGSKPYPEVDGWDMLKYLKNSRRLPKPTKCPDILYNKMLRCWNLDPDERPSFSDLVIELSEIVSSTDEKFETHSDYQSLQNTYINTGIEDYLQLEN